VPNEPAGGRPPSPGWLRRYRIALLLLVLSGIFTGVAAATFPRAAPVYRPDSFGLTATLNGDLKDVTVRVLQGRRDYLIVSILLISGPPPIPKYSQDGIVELFLPPGTRVIGCKHVPGPTRGQQCFGPLPGAVNGGTKLLLMTHAFSPYPSNHNFWTATLDTTLVTNHFAFDSNGLDAEAVLPSAYAFISDPQYSHAVVTISDYYWIPNAASYDWTGTPLPNLITSRYVEWIEHVSSGQCPASNCKSGIALGGINNGAQENANLLSFVAGALIGIAGAALIGAIQEALHAKASKHSGGTQ
jgi:hypothetical protein